MTVAVDLSDFGMRAGKRTAAARREREWGLQALLDENLPCTCGNLVLHTQGCPAGISVTVRLKKSGRKVELKWVDVVVIKN